MLPLQGEGTHSHLLSAMAQHSCLSKVVLHHCLERGVKGSGAVAKMRHTVGSDANVECFYAVKRTEHECKIEW